MKKIQLTQNKFALVDDEDYEYLNQFNWFAHKDKNNFYAVRTDNKLKKSIRMHRIIMDCPDGKFIDHRDGGGLNNQKYNLRVCTKSQNNGNRKISKHNTSGIKGVGWYKAHKKWVARVRVNGKSKFLGYFSDINDAKDAYTKAAKQHFGEFYTDGIRKCL